MHALLNQRVPPRLAIGVIGGAGEPGERVATDRLRHVRCCFVGLLLDIRNRVLRFLGIVLTQTHRCVDEARRPIVARSPQHRAPFRRKLGEGKEVRLLGRGRRIGEYGERRAHPRRRRVRNNVRCLGRPLDEHHLGIDGAERLLEAGRGTGAVVANAEKVQPLVHPLRSPRGWRHTDRASPCARAPPFPGTPAARWCLALDLSRWRRPGWQTGFVHR